VRLRLLPKLGSYKLFARREAVRVIVEVSPSLNTEIEFSVFCVSKPCHPQFWARSSIGRATDSEWQHKSAAVLILVVNNKRLTNRRPAQR
jgi:hypothetical protein